MSQPPARQKAAFIPSLTGLGLPTQLTDSLSQNYTLLYSLRDTTSDTMAKLQMKLDRRIQYGTHTTRAQQTTPSSVPGDVPDGSLWFESDRPTVFYQARIPQEGGTPRWFYAGGIYYDVLANQPTDLGADDTGFLFLAGTQLYRWSGTAWVAV